jgi:hypothetical protein
LRQKANKTEESKPNKNSREQNFLTEKIKDLELRHLEFQRRERKSLLFPVITSLFIIWREIREL